MYNFTIIIPHYNIPELLERCITSIPKRNDIQVIVIDDCSSVSTELHQTFEKIKLIKNLELYYTSKGGSAGRARNIGLDHAKGKWLIFADADDFFDKSLNDIMDKYINAKEDIIYFNFHSTLSEDISQKSTRESTYNYFFKQYEQDQKEENFRFLYSTPWGKMIKRNLVDEYKIRFDETRYANDVMFSVLIGCKAKKIQVINTPIYVLTERDGSLANNFCCKPGETAIRTEVALRVYKTIKEHGYDFSFDYNTFIKILLWNKEFKELLNFYHTIEKYSIKKSQILNIVSHTGHRYYFTCLWLIWKDLILTFLKK